jgi:hypothetical protein
MLGRAMFTTVMRMIINWAPRTMAEPAPAVAQSGGGRTAEEFLHDRRRHIIPFRDKLGVRWLRE